MLRKVRVSVGAANPHFTRFERVVLLAALIMLAAGLTFRLGTKLDDTRNDSDALQNLHSAYNLAYHGVVSMDDAVEAGPANLRPSNYREPFPILTMAAFIALHPELASGYTMQTINQGEAVTTLKQHNLIWVLLCLLGIIAVIWSAVRPPLLATGASAAAMLLTDQVFLSEPDFFNSLLTEIPTATLLLWCSVALMAALRTWRWRGFVAAGGLLGLLALTKAIYLYIGIGFALVLLGLYLLRPPGGSRRSVITRIGVMLAAMWVVMLPWMLRNAVQLGVFGITQRGGVVLSVRANYNQMTAAEYLGALYWWSPAAIQDWLGSRFGITDADFQGGGRFQQINRYQSDFAEADLNAELAGRTADAITYYRRARAERVRLQNQYREQGVENAIEVADQTLRDRAADRILADPGAHLRVTGLVLWRGVWSMNDQYFFWLNLLAALTLFGMAVLGLARQQVEMMAISLLPAATFAFYALASHFIPRYATITHPSLIVSLVVAATWLLAGIVRRLSRQSPARLRLVARGLLVLLVGSLPLLWLLHHSVPLPDGLVANEAGADIYFAADRTLHLFNGDCARLEWAVEGIKAVEINDRGRVGSGEETFCGEAPTMRVILLDDTVRDFALNHRVLFSPEVQLIYILLIATGLHVLRLNRVVCRFARALW